MKKLPIGIQSIHKILSKGDYVYVDKTDFIEKLIGEGSPYYFISRPRRFGKSLFLNTLEEVFKGNKELFKGCAIYNSGYKWEKHPVIYLDFSQIESTTPEELENDLKDILQEIGQSYGLPSPTHSSLKAQLRKLVIGLAKQNRVVILVDEYDQPIINHLSKPSIAEKNREVLKRFFSTLKSLDRYLEFGFITGISKFSHVSLFSGLNNLNDITMDPKYAGMMGYTDEEVKKHFSEEVKAIAFERGETSEEKVFEEVKVWYNGYRFSRTPLCVYNPFSTLNFMSKKETAGYWYSTGTPSFLIDQLKKYPKSMISLDGTTARKDELTDISSLEKIDLKALMYQAGYFTVQDYNPTSKRYYLGLPNKEVRTAFMDSLVEHFTDEVDVRESEKFAKALETYQIDILFEHIKTGFSSFPYPVFAGAKEYTYQAMLLSMLYGMGFDLLSERLTNTGRIDVVLEVEKATYILELKLDGSSKAALKQIQEKGYFKPYMHKKKEIAIIGANFSSDTRNISDWEGELLSPSGKTIRPLFKEDSSVLESVQKGLEDAKNGRLNTIDPKEFDG
ncbi:ATP-binding protein [Candidatus Neptunochlamydia vexilliferae]|uniref:AAA-ATPase-like domain-containing protein n=1 Tax=Candidatus Neptunichlamydia vexilliferae TaxID=1651774 RepID=A0ABS0B066_9BACT|nr:ATP-binding protein [Candidatus Neptunochlamydia vexilliferae]MBF5059589.1 hypothetical protein [Candidatus Neptunochlamydia vexilliferae]